MQIVFENHGIGVSSLAFVVIVQTNKNNKAQNNHSDKYHEAARGFGFGGSSPTVLALDRDLALACFRGWDTE